MVVDEALNRKGIPLRGLFVFLYSFKFEGLTENGKTITNVRIENVTELITTPDEGVFFSNFVRAYTGFVLFVFCGLKT